MDTSARLVISLWLLLLAGFSATAQDQVFDQTYDRIWKKVAPVDLNTAITQADSLYGVALTPVHRMRCMMLIARLYQQKEDLEKSVEYAEKIERIATETDDYAWQARANGYLAGLYRMMELYNKARSYSEKALEIIPKIKDPEQANSTRGLMLQELAFAAKEERKYEQAIRYLNEAGISFSKVQKNRELNQLNNERLIGDNYRLLSRHDSAISHYFKAIKYSTERPMDYTTGLAYRGLAESFLEKGQLSEAKKYLEKAEYIADRSQYLQLKDATYDLSKRYYARIKDREKLLAAGEKSNSVIDTLLDRRAKLLNKMYGQLDRKRPEVPVQDGRHYTIVGVLLLLSFGSVSFILYRRKRAVSLVRQKDSLDVINRQKPAGHSATIPLEKVQTVYPSFSEKTKDTEEAEMKKNTEKRLMPVETEKLLLDKLVEFEKSTAFLETGFSLALLASQLGTNTKYLSYLIRTHKGADFNNYINNLRVDYVVEVLKRDSNWRLHKISVIAAESGFSSSSLFAAVFKARTGHSPSVFIRAITNASEPGESRIRT